MLRRSTFERRNTLCVVGMSSSEGVDTATWGQIEGCHPSALRSEFGGLPA